MTAEATFEQEATKLRKENSLLRESVSYLEEQVAWLKRQIFGQRSEKVIKTLNESQLMLDGFEEVESKPEEKQKVPSHERRKPTRNGKDTIKLPPDLPVERQVIDIPEEEKTCQETGKPLVQIGEEVTLKLAHRPGNLYIKEIVRLKYALPQNSEGGIRIAPLPESLLTRCQADDSLLADILTKKFADHLPLYRQQEMLARIGVIISRQIMAQWVVRAGIALEPLYNEMVRRILESGNLYIDETPIDMLDPGKGKVHQAYMWVMVGGKEKAPPYRVYDFYKDRKHANVEKLLQGYHEVVHSDKYGAYEALANAKKIIWCPCWSHIRRKFFEADTGDPPFRDWVLRKVRHLFMLEKVAWGRSEEERLRIRQEKEIPIIDELITRIKSRLVDGRLLPKSKFREALGYFCSLIPHLKNYTRYPYARLDNNVAERAIRPLAIGRKNWLFVGSEEGGKAAAIIFSLVQSCRAVGANPREYLEDVMRRLMSHNSQKLHELLPDQWLMSYKPRPPIQINTLQP
jgi:transposase